MLCKQMDLRVQLLLMMIASSAIASAEMECAINCTLIAQDQTTSVPQCQRTLCKVL